MKISPLFIVVLTIVFLFSACSRETEIKGDVFVVTEGAGSYKLGLVEVNAIPRKLYESFIFDKRSNRAEAGEKFTALYSQCEALVSNLDGLNYERIESRKDRFKVCGDQLRDEELNLDNVYFENLPKSDAVTTTDADGKFTLKIPKKGVYVLIAKAERLAGAKKEKYYWAIPISADGVTQTVMFSNNNLINSETFENMFKKL